MAPRPWRPAEELDGALERGDLSYAITLAAELSEDRRPPGLGTALRFLPLVAAQRPAEYDRRAVRWLARWVSEASGRTIDQAAEIAATLADRPAQPGAFETLSRL